jgi:hypothetical protein
MMCGAAQVKTKCVNKACAADLVANKDRMVVETGVYTGGLVLGCSLAVAFTISFTITITRTMSSTITNTFQPSTLNPQTSLRWRAGAAP